MESLQLHKFKNRTRMRGNEYEKDHRYYLRNRLKCIHSVDKYQRDNKEKCIEGDKKYAKKFSRKAVTTYRNGKQVVIYGDKRPFPKDGKCEFCRISLDDTYYGYHHWDDNDLSKGLYLCNPCHLRANVYEWDLKDNNYFRKLYYKKRAEFEL